MRQSILLLLLTAIVGIGTYCLFNNLISDQFLRGPDSYYYALQADHWAETGEVKIPDSSILHKYTGSLIRLGLTPETSVHVLWSSLVGVSGLGLLLLLYSSSSFLAFLLMAWLVFSPSLVFGAIEFPKMFSYLLPLSLWFWLVFKKEKYLLAPAVLLMSVFLHKSSIPIVALLLGLNIFLLLKDKVEVNWRKVLPLGGFVVLSSFLYVVFINDRIHLLDLSRFDFSNDVMPGIVALLTREALPLPIKIELIAALVAGVSCFASLFAKRKFLLSFGLASLVLPAIFPFGSSEVMGVGERYAILLPIFLIIFLASLLPKVQSFSWKYAPAAGILILFGLYSINRVDFAHPNHLDPDYRTYSKVTEAIKDFDIPMLIAHKGLNFFYKHQTKKEAFLYEPEDHWSKKRIWRLVYGLKSSQFSFFLSDQCSWETGNIKSVNSREYFLLREDCWNDMRSRILHENDGQVHELAWNSWQNPSEKRPAFLYRKHRESNQDEGEFPALPINNAQQLSRLNHD